MGESPRGFESLRLRHSLGILSEFQGFFFAFMRLKCCLLLRRLPVCSYGRRGCKYLPLSYPSVQASLESSSSVPADDGSAWFVYESKHRMITKMDDILRVQYYMGLALQRLCEKKPLNMKKDFPMLQGVECIQILDMGEKLSEQYYFRSICNYYAYLFLRFLNKKPLVARCHCCGNYFIPKTRKTTLYCDRIFKNGKTCKQIGPTLKHKLNIEKDEVLKTFDKVK